MNACTFHLGSAFDLGGCINGIVGGWLGPYLQWVPWIEWGVAIILILVVLALIKSVTGQWGVMAAVLAFVAIYENVRGRKGQGVLPFKIEPDNAHGIDPRDAQLPPKVDPRFKR